jgi:uncharacterized LabA/DUF88 family protein
VTVVSTVKCQPPLVADELRRQADTFVDLNDLAPLIGRPRPSGGGYGSRNLEPAEPDVEA